MGVETEVEMNGSEGTRNRLAAEDIACAGGVIVVADKKVEISRFDGKKLVNRPVSSDIRKSEELIDLASSGTISVSYGDGKGSSSEEGNVDDTIE